MLPHNLLYRTAIAVLCVVISAGCAVRIPRPALFPEVIAGAEKQQLIKDLKAQDLSVASFRGLARGVLQDHAERAIIRYVILFQKPDRLRIEALPATGAYTLSVLVAKEDGVVVLDPSNEQAYRSNDPSRAIKTALKIPASPDELASYLLGTIPSKFLDESLTARRSATGVQLVMDSFRAYWLLDAETKRLRTVELRRSGRANPSLQLEFGEYVEVQGDLYPRDITIKIPQESVEAKLSFRSVEFNPVIADSAFILKIPEGYSVYEGLGQK